VKKTFLWLAVVVYQLAFCRPGAGKPPAPSKAPPAWQALRPPFDSDLDATVSLGNGNALVFKGNQYALLGPKDGVLASGLLESLPGWPKGWKSVDAATRWTDRVLIIFHDGGYILYDLETRHFSEQKNIDGWAYWPSSWADGIDAAFNGSDDTLYLFRGSEYLTLDKSILSVRGSPRKVRDWKGWPSRWIDGIDSADNPGDGYIYFFRGAELLAYDLRKAAFVKGYPKRIAPPPSQMWPPLDPISWNPLATPVLEWRGLPAPFNSGLLAVASVDKQNSLLFKGRNYLIYNQVRNKDNSAGTITDETGVLAQIPGWPPDWKEVHAAARWNENTLILFNGGSFVRYNLRDRKLGPVKDLTDFIGWPSTWADGIDAALEDDDGDTLYLFRGPVFLTLSKSQQAVTGDPAALGDWPGFPTEWLDGLDGATNPGDGYSYLFRGREVLVWDNDKGKFLDGYPKALPEAPALSTKVWPPTGAAPNRDAPPQRTLEFKAAIARMGRIDAGAPIGGDNLLLFSGSNYYIYSAAKDTVTQTGDLTKLIGWPKDWTKVDAAASWDDRTLVLFSGAQFIQYSTKTLAFRGAPEPLRAIPGWPAGWTDGIDAAANLDDDQLYLFRGSSFVTLTKSLAQVTTAPDSAHSWEGWPDSWTTGPTSAVESAGGRVYFFRGSEYLPYDVNQDTFMAGFPKQIPGTSTGTFLASWPPVAGPSRANVSPKSDPTGENSRGSIVQNQDQLLVTTAIPLQPGEKLTSVNATSLNLNTSGGSSKGRTIPIAVSDPAFFDLKVSGAGGFGGKSGSGGKNPSGTGSSTTTVYRDDYPVNNTITWGLPWVAVGADYVGSGYDPLKLNPANYGDVSNRSPFQAVKLTASYDTNLDGSVAAYCSQYTPGNSSDVLTRNDIVTTLKEYQQHFGIDASFSAGVQGVGEATVGGGYKQVNKQGVGTDHIELLRSGTVSLNRIRMDPTCTDLDSGNSYRQKLDLDFRNRVQALSGTGNTDPSTVKILDPAWISDPDDHAADLKNWRASLSADILQNYTKLMTDYGYLLATSVTLGGQFRSNITITKAQFSNSNETGWSFQRDVKGSLEGIELGSSLSLTGGTLTASANGSQNVTEQSSTSGGTPSTDLDTWLASVAAAPAPIGVGFTALADFVTGDFFPDDKLVAAKSQILRGIMLAHLENDGLLPCLTPAELLNAVTCLPPDGTFFDQTPRTYQISFVSANSSISRFFILNNINYEIVEPDFTLAASGGGTLPPSFFGIQGSANYLKIASGPENTVVNAINTPITITVPPDEGKLHFWGLLSNYTAGCLTPPGCLTSDWTRIDDKIVEFKPWDFVLSNLTLDQNGSTQTVALNFTDDSADTITFNILVRRTQ